jgi:hypothetical protein
MRTVNLTPAQASKLKDAVGHYKPEKRLSWKHKSNTNSGLWLRVLSQIVVVENAAPAQVLNHSKVVGKILGFSKLKTVSDAERRKRIHQVLLAIGTRYVGESSDCPKVKAALHNFDALDHSKRGPKGFFADVASRETTLARTAFLSKKLKYYKKKGCRDTLIDLRIDEDCMALDQRIKKILLAVGAKVPKSIDRDYENIERQLIRKVANPLGLTGGQLDRILFQNSREILVRLLNY